MNDQHQSDQHQNDQHPAQTTRGFAAMNTEKQREIASKGGRAAHLKGTAHEFSSDEARAAGRKGGLSVSQNRAHMAEIGRQGGKARGRRMYEVDADVATTNIRSPEPTLS